jgi:glycosyltransferase involved in cell wall biosynthesis
VHILFIPSWYATSRIPVLGSFFREQALAIAREGVQTGIIYPEFLSLYGATGAELLSHRFQIETVVDEGIPIMRVKGWLIPTLRRLSRKHWGFQVQRLLEKYIAIYGKPDLIHAQCVHEAGIAADKIKTELGIPFVITEHFTGYRRGALAPYQLDQARMVFLNADKIISVSHSLAKDLLPYTGDRQTTVVPNMVDVDYFTLPEKPRLTDPFTFVVICFLVPKKGVDRLLRAFAKSFSNHEPVKLVIGGEGDQRCELETLSTDLGINDKVEFTGLLSRQEVREVMWKSNALVSSSHVETFGVTLIEAMSTGLPVISTNSGGPAELINDQVGMLVPEDDEDALGRAMYETFTKRQAWSESASSIHQYTAGRFSEPIVAKQLLNIYRSTLQAQEKLL